MVFFWEGSGASLYPARSAVLLMVMVTSFLGMYLILPLLRSVKVLSFMIS